MFNNFCKKNFISLCLFFLLPNLSAMESEENSVSLNQLMKQNANLAQDVAGLKNLCNELRQRSNEDRQLFINLTKKYAILYDLFSLVNSQVVALNENKNGIPDMDPKETLGNLMLEFAKLNMYNKDRSFSSDYNSSDTESFYSPQSIRETDTVKIQKKSPNDESYIL